MIVTTKISMDLTNAALQQTVDVMQDDKYSRDLRIALYSGNDPVILPQITGVLIRYCKPDGKKGVYDTLPDGSCAWHISGNEVTVRLAPQTCTVPGKVQLSISLLQGEAQLSCFQLCLQVQPLPQANMPSEDYENTLLCLPQCSGAEAGRYLQVSQVDNAGRVMALQSVELPDIGEAGAVTYGPQQLTQLQKLQARANIAAAPTGFGLGGTYEAEALANADDALVTGWYTVDDNTENLPVSGASGVLYAASTDAEKMVYQRFYPGAADATVERRSFDGVWGQWEWVNPPMVIGTEYRTPQRWNGKALYTKLINCGLMPANGSVSIALGISASSIQQANLVGHRSNTRAAVFYPNLTCSFSGTSAYVAYNAANTDVTAYLTVYYTKD